jgi:hypothetical protein
MLAEEHALVETLNSLVSTGNNWSISHVSTSEQGLQESTFLLFACIVRF